MKNATMALLAIIMASPLGNMPLEKVIDGADLPGRYDITLDFKNFNRSEYHDYREIA